MFTLLASIVNVVLIIYTLIIILSIIYRFLPQDSQYAFLLKGIDSIVEPFFQVIRKIVPVEKTGMDLSPLLAIIILYLVRTVLVALIAGIGAAFMLLFKLFLFFYLLLVLVYMLEQWGNLNSPRWKKFALEQKGFQKIHALSLKFTPPIVEIIKQWLPKKLYGIDHAAIVLFFGILLLAIIF